MGKPVEIVFEFDTVRNFSAIILHTNNMYTKDVQVSLKTALFHMIYESNLSLRGLLKQVIDILGQLGKLS